MTAVLTVWTSASENFGLLYTTSTKAKKIVFGGTSDTTEVWGSHFTS